MLNSKNHLKVWILSGLLFLGFPSKLWSQKNVIYSYFKERLHYTPEAKAANTGGLILIQLKVNDKGELIRKDEIRTLGNGLNQQVNEIIRSVKNWNDFLSGWHGEIDLRIPVVFQLREQVEGRLDSSVWHIRARKKMDPQEDNKMEYIEEMPEYPGGDKALYQFISDKLRYPKKAIRESIMGRVTLQFVIDTAGDTKNLAIEQGISPDCDAEALRVIAQMKKWKPGIQNGKPVRVSYKLPITFELETDLFQYRSSNLIKIDTIYCWNHDTLFAQFPGGQSGFEDSVSSFMQPYLKTLDNHQSITSEINLEIQQNGQAIIQSLKVSEPTWEEKIRSLIQSQQHFKSASFKGQPIESKFKIYLELFGNPD